MHNDICREFHNLTINPTMGTSNLLSYGSIILKLFEANLWYSQVGNRRLRELAKSRGKLQLIEDKLKEMKLILRPSRIEKYAEIRNKLAGHYDNQIVNILQELAAIRPDAFEDIEMVVRYSQEWLQALRSIEKLEAPESTV